MAPKLDQKKTLLFDIEAGGLYAHKSSLLSIAYGTGTDQVQEIYARPSKGSWLSKWSETQVLSKIKKRLQDLKRTAVSEEMALTQFLTVLKSHVEQPGAEIAGFNIGFTPQAQVFGEQRIKGFDIPFLMTRARKYGLEHEYRKAFSKASIRDVGAEWAARIAGIVSKPQYKGIVEKDLWEQAAGLQKAIRGAGLEHAPLATRARFMQEGGYKFAGWKQESVYSLLGMGEYKAHMAHEDVGALRAMMDTSRSIIDEESFVREWNKSALVNKLVSSVKWGSKNLEEIQPLLAQYGIEGEFNKKLDLLLSAVGASKADIAHGRGIPEAFTKVASEHFAPGSASSLGILESAGRKALQFATEHKAGVGISLGAAALLTLKPLGWFSGFDDEYNTIEGLRHGGQAAAKRKSMTDFGSGWVMPVLQILDDIIPAFLLKTHAGRKIVRDVREGFSAKDDEYNTIEGMPHGWYGNQRGFHTAFGSGWDALRGFVKAGETFAGMLEGSEFKAALKVATQGKMLGDPGAWGKVYEMTSTFRGQEFKFARKIGNIGKFEVEAQRAAQEKFSPTVYGFTARKDIKNLLERSPHLTVGPGQLDMELFEGRTLRQAFQGKITKEGMAERAAKVRRYAQENMPGWEAKDVNPSNIMFIPKGNGEFNVGVIDFGQWKPRPDWHPDPLVLPKHGQTYGQQTGLAEAGMAQHGRHKDTDFGSAKDVFKLLFKNTKERVEGSWFKVMEKVPGTLRHAQKTGLKDIKGFFSAYGERWPSKGSVFKKLDPREFDDTLTLSDIPKDIRKFYKRSSPGELRANIAYKRNLYTNDWKEGLPGWVPDRERKIWVADTSKTKTWEPDVPMANPSRVSGPKTGAGSASYSESAIPQNVMQRLGHKIDMNSVAAKNRRASQELSYNGVNGGKGHRKRGT